MVANVDPAAAAAFSLLPFSRDAVASLEVDTKDRPGCWIVKAAVVVVVAKQAAIHERRRRRRVIIVIVIVV
jgi:hypothetical protein